MAKHSLERDAAEVRIFSRDEAKQDAMRHAFANPRVRFYLGDTRDPESIERVVRGTDLIFHAAALKQVPSAEFFPLEAVKTNINGSAKVLRSAIENGVKGVVCLSTDKAVYPIDAMGMTKAPMEKTAQAFAKGLLGFGHNHPPDSIWLRNVFAWLRNSTFHFPQIKNDKLITITEPTMARLLMSLAESVDLVEYAFEHARSGDLFVRKAPASTIEVLAQALIDLFGGPSKEIQQIGPRHREKLYESARGTEERAKAEGLSDYFRVPLDSRPELLGLL